MTENGGFTRDSTNAFSDYDNNNVGKLLAEKLYNPPDEESASRRTNTFESEPVYHEISSLPYRPLPENNFSENYRNTNTTISEGTIDVSWDQNQPKKRWKCSKTLLRTAVLTIVILSLFTLIFTPAYMLSKPVSDPQRVTLSDPQRVTLSDPQRVTLSDPQRVTRSTDLSSTASTVNPVSNLTCEYKGREKTGASWLVRCQVSDIGRSINITLEKDGTSSLKTFILLKKTMVVGQFETTKGKWNFICFLKNDKLTVIMKTSRLECDDNGVYTLSVESRNQIQDVQYIQLTVQEHVRDNLMVIGPPSLNSTSKAYLTCEMGPTCHLLKITWKFVDLNHATFEYLVKSMSETSNNSIVEIPKLLAESKRIYTCTLLDNNQTVATKSFEVYIVPSNFCVDKVVGDHPHPCICSRYITCHAGNIHERHCPPNLFFHSVSKNCEIFKDSDCKYKPRKSCIA